MIVGEDGASRPPGVRTFEYDGTGSGQPLGADRGCQVLRPGTPASLAGGCPLPGMRQNGFLDDFRSHLTASVTLDRQGAGKFAESLVDRAKSRAEWIPARGLPRWNPGMTHITGHDRCQLLLCRRRSTITLPPTTRRSYLCSAM